MVEPTLNVDSFKRNPVLTGDEAYLRHIYNLVVMKPGTDPLNPNKGCDFNSYHYRLKDDNELRALEQTIKDQASEYLGYYLRTVSAKPIKVGNDLILHCFVVMEPIGESLLISTNGVSTQFTKIKNLSEKIN